MPYAHRFVVAFALFIAGATAAAAMLFVATHTDGASTVSTRSAVAAASSASPSDLTWG